MSKLAEVKGELPTVERDYEVDDTTKIEVRDDGTWYVGHKTAKGKTMPDVSRLARSRIILDGMLTPIDSDEDRGIRVLIDGRAYTVTRENVATGTE